MSLVIDLYRAGLSVREIALRVYGEDTRRARQRVHSIINLYGKRLGLLKGERVYQGEIVESRTGVCLGVEVSPGFVEHSKPVTNSAPFLGSYCNFRQLKASLRKCEVRVVNIMAVVDRFLGPLNISHDSVVREEAMLLARRFANGSYRMKELAAAASFVSVARHRPGLIVSLIEVLDANGVAELPLSLVAEMLAVLGQR